MLGFDTELLQPLIKLYIQLGGGVLLGWVLGRFLPKRVPTFIGQFLFGIGVPISIITFLGRADLSGAIWIAPVAAWVAIFGGAGLAWGAIALSLIPKRIAVRLKARWILEKKKRLHSQFLNPTP